MEQLITIDEKWEQMMEQMDNDLLKLKIDVINWIEHKRNTTDNIPNVAENPSDKG